MDLTADYTAEYSSPMSTTAHNTTERVRPMPSLKVWREAKKLTQDEAAKILGIGQAYYSKLEQGKQHPRPALLKQITERTGVPIEELLGIAV